MDDERVEADGSWLCKHEGGHVTRLNEKDARTKPPHYVVCPDCGTCWIVWQYNLRKMAKAVVVPCYG